MLRPLDAIQPYRLEMGSRLKTRRGQNLYEYWRDDLSKALNVDAEATGSDVLVNCASQEYFGAVALKDRQLFRQKSARRDGPLCRAEPVDGCRSAARFRYRWLRMAKRYLNR